MPDNEQEARWEKTCKKIRLVAATLGAVGATIGGGVAWLVGISAKLGDDPSRWMVSIGLFNCILLLTAVAIVVLLIYVMTREGNRQLARVEPVVSLSPFTLKNALRQPNSSILLGGQNFNWMFKDENLAGEIVKFLDKDRNREFKIVICDYRKRTCMNAWSHINVEAKEAGSMDNYKGHLMQAERFINITHEGAKAKGIEVREDQTKDVGSPGFAGKLCDLFPLEVMFVNPADDNGYLAFQPIINGSRKGNMRPQFIVTRSKNPRVFEFYWDHFRTLFGYSRPFPFQAVQDPLPEDPSNT